MIDTSITFLLPLSASKNIDLFINIQIRSFIKFFNLNEIHEFIIICKDSEYEYILDKCKKYINLLKLKIIKENIILKKYNISRRFDKCTWKLQIFLKLAISYMISTKLYCTLDCDIYLTRKCSIKDFFYNNKVIYDKSSMNIHKEWWDSSSRLLSFNINKNNINCGCGVTPFIFKTDIVNELNEYLIKKNKNLFNIFFNTDKNSNITEYTLYWIYILKFKNYEDIYIDKSISDNQIWTGVKYLNDDKTLNYEKIHNKIKKQFESNGLFSLINNRSFIFDNKIYSEILKYL